MSRIFFYLWLYLGEELVNREKSMQTKCMLHPTYIKLTYHKYLKKNILNNNNDENLLISPNVYK